MKLYKNQDFGCNEMLKNNYKISDEKLKDIIFGYINTNAGAKKLSWFYEVELSVVKQIIKDLKEVE